MLIVSRRGLKHVVLPVPRLLLQWLRERSLPALKEVARSSISVSCGTSPIRKSLLASFSRLASTSRCVLCLLPLEASLASASLSQQALHGLGTPGLWSLGIALLPSGGLTTFSNLLPPMHLHLIGSLNLGQLPVCPAPAWPELENACALEIHFGHYPPAAVAAAAA